MRKFGYSVRGMRAEVPHLLTRGECVTANAAIDCEARAEVDFITSTVNADTFFDFVRGSLLPSLQPFDGINRRSVVIMDNCTIHHADSTAGLFEA